MHNFHFMPAKCSRRMWAVYSSTYMHTIGLVAQSIQRNLHRRFSIHKALCPFQKDNEIVQIETYIIILKAHDSNDVGRSYRRQSSPENRRRLPIYQERWGAKHSSTNSTPFRYFSYYSLVTQIFVIEVRP